MNSYTVMLWFCDEIVLHAFFAMSFLRQLDITASWNIVMVTFIKLWYVVSQFIVFYRNSIFYVLFFLFFLPNLWTQYLQNGFR